jgi:hypothetical protein
MVKKPKKPTKKIQVKDLDSKKNPKGGWGGSSGTGISPLAKL